MSVNPERPDRGGFGRYLSYLVVFGLGLLSGALLEWQSPRPEASAESDDAAARASGVAAAAEPPGISPRERSIEPDVRRPRERADENPPHASEPTDVADEAGRAAEVAPTGTVPGEAGSPIAKELPHVKREAERVYALAAELPLPLQRHTYRVRGYRHGERFHSPKLGRLSSPRTVPLNRLSGGDVSPEQRESAQTRLWELERRRREVEVALYERQNELIAEYDSTREPLPRVEFFFSTDRGLYVIREGDDAEHGRLLRELREMDAAIDTFTSEFRRGTR